MEDVAIMRCVLCSFDVGLCEGKLEAAGLFKSANSFLNSSSINTKKKSVFLSY